MWVPRFVVISCFVCDFGFHFVFCFQVAKRFLDFANWLLSWSRYALAAAMVGQMSYRTAMQHLSVCTEAIAWLLLVYRCFYVLFVGLPRSRPYP